MSSEVARNLDLLLSRTSTCRRFVCSLSPRLSSFLTSSALAPARKFFVDCRAGLWNPGLICFATQYPFKEQPREVQTALTSEPSEDIAKTRARNALKILLDVHGDFGRRSSV